MAKLEQLKTVNKKPKKPVVDENPNKLKEVAAGQTELYKYDYDFGCVRFRGVKVKRGKDLQLNMIDIVDSVSLQKRNFEIASIDNQIAEKSEASSSVATATAMDDRLRTGQVPISYGDVFNEENATGCTVM